MNKSQFQLLPIKYGTTPKILLLGNGINKAFEKDSWDELLKKIACKTFSADEWELIKKAPYPLQTVMITSCKLTDYLADINKQAENMYPALIKQLAEKEGVTEQIKAENSILCIQQMNNIRNRANEIVNTELIYT